jgi:DNA (cytosine-5)-methyltransferase 1
VIRPQVLDLFCCQGGAAKGYEDAGFTVAGGVDLDPQPRYPYPFVQADAVRFLYEHAEWIRQNVALAHASPPCQLDSDCQRIMDNEHPDLIGPTRDALEFVGVPYVLENVGGALPKLRAPVELCGWMFGLQRTYRHRYFETGGWALEQPPHPEHTAEQTKLGRAPQEGETVQAIGHFSGVGIIRDEWQVPWMNRDGIREAIPPAYTEWIGTRFLSRA